MRDSIRQFMGAYRFLSNFYPSVIEYEGITYPTVEHAFQAAKTLDRGERLMIQRAETPGIAKRLGRRVRLRPMWDDCRLQVMEEILRIKFSDPELLHKLLETQPAKLIEGNTWNDEFWGAIVVGDGLVGKNHLGKLLMKIRDEEDHNDGTY